MATVEESIDKDKKPRVSFIILNWNGWKDTIECLESVFKIVYPSCSIIVVDNGSGDGSLEKIKQYLEGKLVTESPFFTYSDDNKPIGYTEYSRKEAEAGGIEKQTIHDVLPEKNLIIIKNEKNYGFAEGNNIAIRYIMKSQQSEYILLLNNDTVVERSFLDELVSHAESDRKIGFVGPKTLYYDYYGRTDVIAFAGGRFEIWRGRALRIGNRETDTGQYDEISTVDYIEGSCLLAKVEVLEKTGLLDPSFFTYWEETDLCIRARNAGYHLDYVPGAKIWHKVAASNKGNTKNYFFVRNRLVLLRRYATRFQLLFFGAYFLGFEFWYLNATSLMYYRSFSKWKSLIRGVYDGMIMPVKRM